MACGENPKRVYQEKGPSTRMGNMAGYRAAFAKAEKYRREWDAWLAKKKGDPPDRDLQLETLADVLRGKAFVQNHCYRADEMAQMLDLAREFGFHIRSFHHAVEAYKIADLLARDSVAQRGLGRLVGLQDGVARRHSPERCPAAAGRRPRHHPLRQRRGNSAAQPGGRQGDVRRP